MREGAQGKAAGGPVVLSFFWKVFGGMVAVVLITAGVVYTSFLSRLEQNVARSTEERVFQDTHLVAELAQAAWLETSASFDMERLARAAEVLVGSRVTLIAADGVVLYDSHESPAEMDNHLQRAELRDLGTVLTRYSRTLGKEMTYCAASVRAGGELRAYARVAIGTVEREARVRDLRDAVRVGVLFTGLASLLLAGIFARRVTQPLSQIAALVDEVGRGETTRRLQVDSKDEVGQLARAVNKMADELAQKIGRIERDRAEREAILSAMTDGLLAFDLQAKVLFVNRSARNLFGITREKVKGSAVLELCRTPELNELILRSIESAGVLHADGKFSTEEGERQVQMSAVPLAGVGGDRRGSVLVLRDVTELKRLEAVRRDFVSNVSHELKTPLTAMGGFVEAVMEDQEMTVERRQLFLSKALRNTQRLGAIVTDLLSLSRLESTENALAIEPLDAAGLMADVVQDLADYAESHDIRLHAEPCAGALVLHADQQAMSLALSNLVVNAVRYSPPGGVVTLGAHVAGGEIRIEVRDQGPGIALHEQERIFERFYRIDKARSRTLGGTGLGLAIVRHVMVSHGGRVELESAPGEGCLFRLVLAHPGAGGDAKASS